MLLLPGKNKSVCHSNGVKMKQLPGERLNPKIKLVWRINDFIWITILLAIVAIPTALVGNFEPDAQEVCSLILIITAIVYVVMLLVWLAVLPPLRFVRWRYQLSDDFLDIARGIIWRKRFIIPFIRVQNTDTRQGPIMRIFGLTSVTVSTAAGNHEIPGLSNDVAEQLRDKAAELARIAQEDV
jgi:membrane protein YdbS with pleckstrin-like domain